MLACFVPGPGPVVDPADPAFRRAAEALTPVIVGLKGRRYRGAATGSYLLKVAILFLETHFGPALVADHLEAAAAELRKQT